MANEIAADAVVVRLDEAHHGVGRDGRVHRVPAALEDLDAGARGERMAGGDDAVLRRDLRIGPATTPAVRPP